MTIEERRLCRELIVTPPKGVRRTTKEEFLRQFPDAVEDGSVSTTLLERTLIEKSSDDLQCVLIVGYTFGFSPSQADILCRLLEADWHVSHEDLVGAMDKLRLPQSVDSLYRATQWIPEYLSYDDSRALAVKAIWALGKIPGSESEGALRRLVSSSVEVLSDTAKHQLRRRQNIA